MTSKAILKLAAVWLLAGAATCFGQVIRKAPGLSADRWNFDSPAWSQAEKIGDFKVLQEGDKPATAPRYQTEVRMLHDGENLYVLFTALDTEVDKVKAAALDEFADEFPRGDHGELWITQGGGQIYAFDPNGNKYDARYYDSRFFSGFQVKSRRGADRWQCIAVLPLKGFFGPQGEKKLSIAFVRHVDHGQTQFERSTVAGKPESVRPTFTLE